MVSIVCTKCKTILGISIDPAHLKEQVVSEVLEGAWREAPPRSLDRYLRRTPPIFPVLVLRRALQHAAHDVLGPLPARGVWGPVARGLPLGAEGPMGRQRPDITRAQRLHTAPLDHLCAPAQSVTGAVCVARARSAPDWLRRQHPCACPPQSSTGRAHAQAQWSVRSLRPSLRAIGRDSQLGKDCRPAQSAAVGPHFTS